MLPETTSFNFKAKLCEVIDLSMLISKMKFLWRCVCVPDFREGQVENRNKTGKMLNFPGFERKFLPFVLEW